MGIISTKLCCCFISQQESEQELQLRVNRWLVESESAQAMEQRETELCNAEVIRHTNTFRPIEGEPLESSEECTLFQCNREWNSEIYCHLNDICDI